MMKKIVLFLVSGLFAALTTGAQELAYNEKRVDESAPDSTLRNEDPIKLYEVQVTGRSKLRMLRESAMPVSVIGERQLQGSANNLNDVLARTVGVTIRNTGGLGSASRISVRGLEGKRIGMYIDEAPMSQLSNFVALNDVPTDMIERIEVYKGLVPYRLEIITKEGQKINRYTPSDDQSNADGTKGKRVGVAYELDNGEIIYVPE